MQVRHWVSGRGTQPAGRGVVLRAALAAVGAALLATVALVTPAHADGKPSAPSAAPPATAVPGGFTTWAELFSVQDKLNAAANRILATGSTGYAGIVAAPESRQLRVYWQGAVPASVRGLAGQLGVPVSFLPARFTQRQLVAEAKRLAADARVATVAPKVDGSGLAVTVTTMRTSGADVLGTARVPLAIITGPRPQGMFSRQNDIPPVLGRLAVQQPGRRLQQRVRPARSRRSERLRDQRRTLREQRAGRDDSRPAQPDRDHRRRRQRP
jgi:hypothetical protein